MAHNDDSQRLNVLERLDLALASRVADVPPLISELVGGEGLPAAPIADRCEWVAGMLGLRGLLIQTGDVRAVINGDRGRFGPDHHEYSLIAGLLRVHQRLIKESRRDRELDGWILVDYFKMFVRDVARFRNNFLRRDTPWDAILYVKYPPADEVSDYLDNFNRPNAYMDHAVRFDSLHPVRQAFRVLWHFARVAPFPDFNITMAWVAMDVYLLHAGYPMIVPSRGDRERLHKMMTGPVPLRIREFESRLLDELEGRESA